ncbi:hypothetical protein V6N12_033820 [Hibiscus sabdariffa]|uniref:Uncharacterized protein n=1 Tax=Hibiscus sabdariffa TaxID=183260 RepID=A0ABR2A768_9ROSI
MDPTNVNGSKEEGRDPYTSAELDSKAYHLGGFYRYMWIHQELQVAIIGDDGGSIKNSDSKSSLSAIVAVALIFSASEAKPVARRGVCNMYNHKDNHKSS